MLVHIEIKKLDKAVKVYNFEVEDDHTYTMIKNSALQLVNLLFSGGSPLDYAHVLCNFFQGLAGLAGGVGFTLGAAVGMTRQCFVAGTKVKTEDGDKNIEEIEEGDLVWAYDPVTGETGLKEVKQTFENETETLVVCLL